MSLEPDTTTSFFSSVSESRAKKLNHKAHKRQEEKVFAARGELLTRLERQYGKKFRDLKTQNFGTLFREFVQNRDDAEAFMEIMYPQLPKMVQLAYVKLFDDAVHGRSTIDERLVFDKNEKPDLWDPMQDLEQERQRGIINLTNKRLDELLRDEEAVTGKK